MELRHYLSLVRRWWWLVLLGGIVAGVSTYFVYTSRPAIYRATSTVFVNQTAQLGAVTYSDALLNQQLVKTYAQMAQKPVVLEAATKRLGVSLSTETLSRMVAVRPVRDTQLFEIAVEGPDPSLDRNIANMVANIFIEQQRATLPADQAASAIRVAQEALQPTEPTGPGLPITVVLGVLAGMLLLGGVALLLEYLDDTVKTPEDLDAAGGIATLGAIHRIKSNEGPAAPMTTSRGPVAEAFRLVRANLDFATVNEPARTLLVTSASPSEGKTTTAANLAQALAEAGKKVVLVDADLRRPSLHRIYTLPNRRGLTSLLLEETPEFDGVLHNGATEGLHLLPSGPIPPNPAELLSSPRLQVILDRLKEISDLVIVDSPPVLAAADALILAAHVDGTVLVVDSAHSRAEPVRRAAEALTKSGTRILGGVLNKLGKRGGGYYYSYYYYYSSDGAAAS